MLPVLTSKMCKKNFYKVASYKLGNYTGGGGGGNKLSEKNSSKKPWFN